MVTSTRSTQKKSRWTILTFPTGRAICCQARLWSDNLSLLMVRQSRPARVLVLIKVLKSFQYSWREIVGKRGIHMPLEDGKSKGFLFYSVQRTAQMADAAIQQMHGKSGSEAQVLVNRLVILKYGIEGSSAYFEVLKNLV